MSGGGPKTDSGKRRSSQNSFKHGLSSKSDFRLDPLYEVIVEDLERCGYDSLDASAAASALLECIRVSEAYHSTYLSVEFNDTPFIKAPSQLAHFHKNQGGPLNNTDIKTIIKLVNGPANEDREYGSIVGKRIAKLHPLIRFHRRAVASLQIALNHKK